MTDNTWTLDIYSWEGMSIGATHYYAEIRDPDFRSKGNVKHKMTIAEATAVNKKNRRMYNDELYELYMATPGDETEGFDTKEDAITEAVKQWLEYAPAGSKLIDHKDKMYKSKNDVRVYAVKP